MLSQLLNWLLAALELEGIKTVSVYFSGLYTRISNIPLILPVLNLWNAAILDS